MKKLLESKKTVVIASFVGLYLVVTGISYLAFTFLGDSNKGGSKIGNDLEGLARERAKIVELPKTEECPINGGMFTEVERDIWEGRRPVAAIVENHEEGRPYFGLSRADVIYEAVAEGGITRFLAIFYCGASSEDFRIAAVRSARVYFIKWAAEYGDNPIFLHWGGANNIDNNSPSGQKYKGAVAPEVDAFSLLDKIGWRNGRYGNDLDGQSNIGVPVIKRLNNRLGPDIQLAAEHTPTAFMDELYKEADNRGFAFEDSEGNVWHENFREWKFKDEQPSSNPEATEIEYEFWSNKPDYDVRWVYDSANNAYKRFTGGEPQIDADNENVQIAAKNVLIQFISERGPVDKELHMYYENVDDGEIILFQNGEVITGTWEKEDIYDRTLFYDEDGNEIKFVRGSIWIEAVPIGNDIVY